MKENPFSVFKYQPEFKIDKNKLKKDYFKLIKSNHPDNPISSNTVDVSKINDAYKILNDDYLRAKYLTKDVNNKYINDNRNDLFLLECLEIESKINDGVNLDFIKRYLENKIEECKRNYKNISYFNKWTYYRNLLNKISRS
ncbi:HSCB [Hepatospora eriocheir]|uniref:HSCB n=1 Tax=Hepatospora eriocheir TaxID=1081669 RepID=A0A1X0QGW2_9MICR|nr:HSCB [Hepatospora eriocheir]